MAKKNNIDLVEFMLKIEKLPSQYILGGFGRILTEDMIQRSIDKGVRHTEVYQNTIRKGIGKHAVDCVGIIKWFLWQRSGDTITYNVPKGSDQNVGMMYRSATETGKLENMPDLPGLLVFTKGLTHVGVYIGKNDQGEREYIEATPAFKAWGITRSNDKMRTWETWGRYHLIEYVAPAEPDQPDSDLKVGTKVRWSGRLYRDSMGNGATGSYRERDGIIDIINNNKYGVHIRNMGWIMSSQIKETRDAVYHTVQRGETLWGIGKKYNVKWNDIYKNNKTIIGRTPSLIKPGMRLFIK